MMLVQNSPVSITEKGEHAAAIGYATACHAAGNTFAYRRARRSRHFPSAWGSSL